MPRVLSVTLTAVAVTVALAAPVAGTATPALAATCSQAYLPLPDPSCQPGATNPDVTQSTIGSTVCVSGWTSTVRPPTSYTNPLKVQQIAEYGYSDTSTADYEEDHLIHWSSAARRATRRTCGPSRATTPAGRPPPTRTPWRTR